MEPLLEPNWHGNLIHEIGAEPVVPIARKGNLLIL